MPPAKLSSPDRNRERIPSETVPSPEAAPSSPTGCRLRRAAALRRPGRTRPELGPELGSRAARGLPAQAGSAPSLTRRVGYSARRAPHIAPHFGPHLPHGRPALGRRHGDPAPAVERDLGRSAAP